MEVGATVRSVTAGWSPPEEPQSTLQPVIAYYMVDCGGDQHLRRVNFTEDNATVSCSDLPTAGKEYTVTVQSHSEDKTSNSSIWIYARESLTKLTRDFVRRIKPSEGDQ